MMAMAVLPASDKAAPRPATPVTRIIGVGTATTPDSYTQDEVLATFGITDEKIVSLFRNGAIDRRNLCLPEALPEGGRAVETQGRLLDKHRVHGVEIGARAVLAALAEAGAEPSDVGYLACVTSTGLLTPGFSALISRELGLRRDCARLDVVGMGCNAGLNGLAAVSGWSASNPGTLAVMVCVEICSAAYVFDGTMRSAVVNSLFGDGASAVAVRSGDAPATPAGPALSATVVKFASHLIHEAMPAMRYDWDDDHGKFSFFLDPAIPYVVGANAEQVIGRLLAGTGLRRSDIAHWVVHSGGKKVIDAVKVNLGLRTHDLRHTAGVLRDQGNMSSGSFLFSYQRLIAEGTVRPGDHGIFMTMGPGSTIETALVRW